jgi:hypothetical protein
MRRMRSAWQVLEFNICSDCSQPYRSAFYDDIQSTWQKARLSIRDFSSMVHEAVPDIIPHRGDPVCTVGVYRIRSVLSSRSTGLQLCNTTPVLRRSTPTPPHRISKRAEVEKQSDDFGLLLVVDTRVSPLSTRLSCIFCSCGRAEDILKRHCGRLFSFSCVAGRTLSGHPIVPASLFTIIWVHPMTSQMRYPPLPISRS